MNVWEGRDGNWKTPHNFGGCWWFTIRQSWRCIFQESRNPEQVRWVYQYGHSGVVTMAIWASKHGHHITNDTIVEDRMDSPSKLSQIQWITIRGIGKNQRSHHSKSQASGTQGDAVAKHMQWVAYDEVLIINIMANTSSAQQVLQKTVEIVARSSKHISVSRSFIAYINKVETCQASMWAHETKERYSYHKRTEPWRRMGSAQTNGADCSLRKVECGGRQTAIVNDHRCHHPSFGHGMMGGTVGAEKGVIGEKEREITRLFSPERSTFTASGAMKFSWKGTRCFHSWHHNVRDNVGRWTTHTCLACWNFHKLNGHFQNFGLTFFPGHLHWT